MSKTKPIRPRTDVPSPPTVAKPKAEQELGRTVRETIESIVIAFVLAFLFRTFEAEAFVIPTGSMAPTLQGRHQDVDCENCGYRVRASASEEEHVAERAVRGQIADPEGARRDAQVVAVTCPLCRYRTSVDSDKPSGADHPPFNGDRIIVAKFPYDFVAPKRWDIVVFKFPNDAKTNYIKRLVGLPNETLRIFHGNVYTKPKDATDFQIERKPPDRQLAMAQIVYDNNYVVPEMTEQGWPTRWQPWPGLSKDDTAWTTSADGKSFSIEGGKPAGDSWLRYQHFPPTQTDWRELKDGPITAAEQPRPQLITDFYAYNNGVLRQSQRTPGTPGLDWVGDLMFETQVQVQGNQGKLLLDLVEGGVHFRATIDVSTGQATLGINGQADFKPKATTLVKGPGSYSLIFSNFDDQLTLWVNGSPVEFDAPTTYGSLGNDQPQSTSEDPGDLAPVGVGAEGGLTATVSDLVVKRDIYYIAAKSDRHGFDSVYDYRAGATIVTLKPDELAQFMSDPEAWRRPTPGAKGLNDFELRREVTFPLDGDQFFVLGDNSPASADSRLWENEHHYVERELMIGKALFIYWPHGLYHVPGTRIPFPFGMFPNFSDMGFVR